MQTAEELAILSSVFFLILVKSGVYFVAISFSPSFGSFYWSYFGKITVSNPVFDQALTISAPSFLFMQPYFVKTCGGCSMWSGCSKRIVVCRWYSLAFSVYNPF